MSRHPLRHDEVAALVDPVVACLEELEPKLVEVRRDIHAHPELAWNEVRTTEVVARRLQRAGVTVRRLPGTGLIADVGATDPVRRTALRADIDALPIPERTDLACASTIESVSHACGHDVHTTVVLGAALALKSVEPRLKELGLAVRFLFQPAEEQVPGGAHHVVQHGGLDDVDMVIAVHCDPSVDVGQVGLVTGPVTSACDAVTVTLTGKGGHTSRPHLTEDLTYALAKVVTDVPAVLSRRLDPRSGVVLVWGLVEAGFAANVIPSTGRVSGTVRVLDQSAWEGMGELVDKIVHDVVAPYGVSVETDYTRGVPPVVNAASAVSAFDAAARATLGAESVVPTVQSLGGEDFSWYLSDVEGAMARLGTRSPGGPTYELHQGNLDVDEKAILAGAKVMSCAALLQGMDDPTSELDPA